jgi:hypothetical protein
MRSPFTDFLVVLAATVALAAVAWVDLRLDYQLGLLVFYALPLAWVAWSVGAGWAAVLTVASSVARVWTDTTLVHHYAYGWIAWERGGMRLLTLFFIIFSFRQFRRDLDARSREVRRLEGILPVCIACNRISDGAAQWTDLETYLRRHSQATPQPRLCPACTGLSHA